VEEGPNGGPPQIARLSRVRTLLFEIVQEVPDQFRVEVTEVELGGRTSSLLCGKLQEQTKGVPIGGQRVRTDLTLEQQARREKSLQQAREISGMQRLLLSSAR